MSKHVRAIIALHVNAIGMIVVAWFVGDYLDEQYPKRFSWYLITFGFVFFDIGYHIYRISKIYLREEG